MPDPMVIRSRLRDYTVFFVDTFMAPLKEHVDQGCCVIVDAAIREAYADHIDSIVPQDQLLAIEAIERNKTLEKSQELIETLVQRNFRKNGRLAAIGGGIVQDLTSFTASILYRGVEWSFFPTTLLAQADSCIGGKTSINLGDKKNLVGNFYPPAVIHIDASFLKTLPEEDIHSGIGEMLHYYYYAASPLFERIIRERTRLLANRQLLADYIRESLQIKKHVIEIDEFDREERNKFNYGHTFGHALESLTNYAIKHGQAVTVGMDIANYLSMRQGILDRESYERAHALLTVNFPAYEWHRLDMERYIRFLSKDKKNIGNDLVCILPEGFGRLTKRRMAMDESFRDSLRAYFAAIQPSTSNRQG